MAQKIAIRLPTGPEDYAVPDLVVVNDDIEDHHVANNAYDPACFRLVLEVTSGNWKDDPTPSERRSPWTWPRSSRRDALVASLTVCQTTKRMSCWGSTTLYCPWGISGRRWGFTSGPGSAWGSGSMRVGSRC
ncbi:Uma2 family endonuclease [Streptomyces bauhiniae]|uniref:Uma2 family endonuclease n=1 Tax=Streptomyces bauhiniae TaxID=2340725 RepID=UPI001FCC8853|nr:Uma2 family endonuclease [Streptomyces bauhiniae]